jgi:polysaccharide pyruvyl transferase WcaK-like protein
MLGGLLAGIGARADVIVSTKSPLMLPAPVAGQALSAIPRGVPAEIRALRNCTGVILCGGTHYHDSFAGKRLLYHYLSILRYLAVFLVARLYGKAVYQLGIGVGPCRRRGTRLLVLAGLSLGTVTTVRDQESAEEVRVIAPRARVRCCFDLAGMLPEPREKLGSTVPGATEPVVSVGITVAPVAEGTLAADTWDQLAAAISSVAAHTKLAVRIFVFAREDPGSDHPVAEKLRAALSGSDAAVSVEDVAHDPILALEAIQACDVMVNSRFHGEVLSFLTGRPQIVLPYHRKLVTLAQEIDLPGRAVLTTLRDGAVAAAFAGLVADSDSYRATLTSKVARTDSAANIEALFADGTPHAA